MNPRRSRLVAPLLACVVLLSGAPAALAQRFEKRAVELRAEWAKLAPHASSDRERSRIEEALKAYLERREAALGELLALVENDSAGVADTDASWKRICREVQDRIESTIGSAPESGISDEGYRFCNETSKAEDDFWDRLAGLPVAASRDAYVRNREAVAKAGTDLDVKWSALISTDDALDERQRGAWSRTRDAFRALSVELAQVRLAIPEELEKFFAALKKLKLDGKIEKLGDAIPHEVAPNFQLVVKVLNEFAESMTRKRAEFERARLEFVRLAESEVGSFAIFTQTRKEAREFLEKHGLDVSKMWFSECRDKLDRFAGEVGPTGQKDDARTFRDLALAHLSNRLARNEEELNRVLLRHKDRFFGTSLGGEIVESMLETRAWEDEERTWRSFDLESQLRAWIADGNDFWGLSRIDAPAEEEDLVRQKLRALRDETVACGEALRAEAEKTLAEAPALKHLRDRMLKKE